MKIKTLLSAAIALATLAGAAQAATFAKFNQNAMTSVIHMDLSRLPHTGVIPAAIANKGCTFYENANGGGQSWKKTVAWVAQEYADQTSYAQTVPDIGSWWNDKISSLRCDEGGNVHCSADLSQDGGRKGPDIILWGSQGLVNLQGYGWNDRASSFAVFCTLMK